MKAQKGKSRASKQSYMIGNPVNYDGPTCDVCIQSYQTLMRDMAVEAGISFPPKSLYLMDKAINKFFSAFFEIVTKFQNGSDVESFASCCKERYEDILNVATKSAVGKYDEIIDHLQLVTNKKGYSVNLADLSYYPENLKGILIYLRDEGILLDAVALQKEPKFYIYLYKIVFEMLRVLHSSHQDVSEDIRNQLILLPCSMGQIFQRLNPTEDVMESYANKLLDLLRQPGKDLDKSFLDLFYMVKDDILNKKCTLPYVKEFKKALKQYKFKSYSKGDYYATLKSTTSIIKQGEHFKHYPALISSLFESDEIRGVQAVADFDQFIGYRSAYLTPEEQESANLNVKSMTVKTTMIPNPSKYKPRGIHIGSNSVQDRCNWIHHQLQPVLEALGTDCMRQHHLGVTFLEKISSPSYRAQNKNSIFVSDFSNATDTLDQEFQCLCLGIIFPKQVVDFWRYISQLPKQFYLPQSRKYEPYIQETGQPQGLLASFDAFSLAHHILMLMLMKKSGLEMMDSINFYRILGDDSIVSYPGDREDLYNSHSWLCSCCSLIKNDAKTAKSFYSVDSDQYESQIMDFAHISVHEGVLCTPLPVGLGIFYNDDPIRTKIATLMWFASHEVVFKKMLHHIIFQCYGKDPIKHLTAESILTSGQISYLKPFEDLDFFDHIASPISGLAIYSYGISEIRSTLFNFFISEDEKKKDRLKKSVDFEYVWKGLVNTEMIDKLLSIVNHNHKFWVMLNDAEDLAKDIADLYELDDIHLAACIAPLMKHVGVESNIQQLVDRMNFIHSTFDTEDFFMSLSGINYNWLFPDNKILGQMQVRSLRESSGDISKFLYNATSEAKKQFGNSIQVREWINESRPFVLDYLVDHVYPHESSEVPVA